ncbi:TetR/AcrR family transcriptional regulator [Nonomuraea sp. NPDC050153]|uniref:TetR/AcrR family transcriptional regulator n=1 Tax=Nonomuraea sp. NPDC050153 TaxID=3364359 RepID=UPI0037999E35
MRADARRNRQRIVGAALGLFAEHGPGVSMEEIAQAADLGVGTLYRHFPDRRALVEDIAESTLTALRDQLCSSRKMGPWEALLDMVRYCAGQPLALVTSLAATAPASPSRARLTGEIDALLTDLIKRAQHENDMRSDFTPEQIAGLLNVAICRPGARADDPLTTVLLDGLRETRPTAT